MSKKCEFCFDSKPDNYFRSAGAKKCKDCYAKEQSKRRKRQLVEHKQSIDNTMHLFKQFIFGKMG